MNLGGWFERRQRDGGEEFVTLKDGHPAWLKDAVRGAHEDALPNDWIYEACKAVCDAIDEGELGGAEDDDGDTVHAFADSQVDVYTMDRFRWATAMCLTTLFAGAEEDAAELLSAECDTADRLGTIQFCAYERIARTMLDAWRGSKNEGESEAES